MSKVDNNLMEKIVSLCKRRGFIFQGSEIYGGLAGTFDYGPYGVALKRNIESAWRKRFIQDREDMYEVNADILMNSKAWEASGHVAGFSDPMVEDIKTNKRYRADHLLESWGHLAEGLSVEDLNNKIKSLQELDPKKYRSADGNMLGEVRQFNMMFKTQAGAIEDSSSTVYLRPETAGGMFVNFKNIMDSIHPKLPFGMAQIGKAFRNEITPRDFIFRLREMEQMEIEYFIDPKTWEEKFIELQKEFKSFMLDIGLDENKIHEVEIGDSDRAHYSKRTIDFEYDFPVGQKELAGLAYRGDFDLKSHQGYSKVNLEYLDEDTKTKFLAHVIEPSIGVERSVLAVMCNAYTEEDVSELKDGSDIRTVLKFKNNIAPVKVCVSPLLKNKEILTNKAKEVYASLKKDFVKYNLGTIVYDDGGNIGKRYRKQDEIGTPYCVVIDFETIENDQCVSIRDRDTMEQIRVRLEDLNNYLITKFENSFD
jgi:glycyl-tRNA synthetase